MIKPNMVFPIFLNVNVQCLFYLLHNQVFSKERSDQNKCLIDQQMFN